MTENNIQQTYDRWLSQVQNRDLHEELVSLGQDEAAIEDRFFKELQFGTGGLRGRLGAGTNRMNIHTVGRATLGLADYILHHCQRHSAVIAYDSRHMSADFARLAAEIMSSQGITAYLFDRLMPTPVLSYAVRTLGTGAGIVITASHNPREYNGYKVYNERGCQITDEAAALITRYIEGHGYFEDYTPNEALIRPVGEETLDAFIDTVLHYSLPCDGARLPSVVYTPLNGTGDLPVRKLFAKLGFTDYTVVPEQQMPDGDFPTCPFPNPEEKQALAKAIALAQKTGAQLVIATDPDADRVGIAERGSDGAYRLFNGNETGLLLLQFILSQKQSRGELTPRDYVVKTIVTTSIAERVAQAYGVGVKRVLTGFKYIGETIDRSPDERYLFGMEESYGYLVGTHARDKDAISAVMSIVQMAAYYGSMGQTLAKALDALYQTFGYECTALCSTYFEGKSGMEYMSSFMDEMRRLPPRRIGGCAVTQTTDYAQGIDGLPKSNVMEMKGEGFSVIVRPSGTEPKLKFYLSAQAATQSQADERVGKLREWVEGCVSHT